jgi:hypothetical protein
MSRLEGTRRELYGLGESKAITSEVYVSLASEPFGRWPTGRNRLVCVCVCKCQLERTEEFLGTVPGFLAVQIYLHRSSVTAPSAAGIARLTFYNMHGNFAYISLC